MNHFQSKLANNLRQAADKYVPEYETGILLLSGQSLTNLTLNKSVTWETASAELTRRYQVNTGGWRKALSFVDNFAKVIKWQNISRQFFFQVAVCFAVFFISSDSLQAISF